MSNEFRNFPNEPKFGPTAPTQAPEHNSADDPNPEGLPTTAGPSTTHSERPHEDSPPRWERTVLEKLAMETIAEQRRRRRWGIFFKLIGFAYLTVLILIGFGGLSSSVENTLEDHVALVDLKGVISTETAASADRINPALRQAFEAPTSKAVILRINSPGGSPVQSGLINTEMKRLRAKYPDKPLYVVVEEIAASGGYYIAVGADQIYVDKASLIGSIGVLMNGFGFVDTLDKLGIERRLITAGENKGFLDPFSQADPAQVEYAQNMIKTIHKQFIDVVKQGRGARLKDDAEVFSGLVWTGEQGVSMGLADAFGSVASVARDVVKIEKIYDYTVQDSLAERLAKTVGVSVGAQIGSILGLGQSTPQLR